MRARGVRTATVLVFVFYPSVSRTIFAGLPCVQLDTNEYWMENDLQTPCSSEGVPPMIWQCILATLIFPLGLPLATLAVLFKTGLALANRGLANSR